MAIVGRAKYTRARAKFRGETTRGERQKFSGAWRPLEISRTHVCISLAPQSPSPKLDYSQCTVFLTVKLPTSGWQTRIKKSNSNSLTSIGIVRFDYFDCVVHQKRFRLNQRLITHRENAISPNIIHREIWIFGGTEIRSNLHPGEGKSDNWHDETNDAGMRCMRKFCLRDIL